MNYELIPKNIHYCWFGGNPLPPSAIKCIDSWKKYLPDYEIIEWNESNFDVHSIPYTSEAYKARKFAFVSDYARFKILYEYGGLYFDTDVEIIKSIDDIIERGPFMGIEMCGTTNEEATRIGVAPGLGLGCNPGLGLLKELLDIYAQLHFLHPDGSLNRKTIVAYTTELLLEHGLKPLNILQECAGFYIYPSDYFNPKDKASRKITLTENTRAIHHFDATWLSKDEKLKKKVQYLLGPSVTKTIVKLKGLFR